MGLTLLGTKLGMTRVFTDEGKSVPVTVLRVGPCVVTQVKTAETDGYEAVQVGYEDIKPRRSTMQLIGHDAKAGTAPKRRHVEFRVDDASGYELGQTLTVGEMSNYSYVDVRGISKGKGFQGSMKRHNFRGLEASHGVERKHRSPGSIGGHATNLGTGPKVKKGKKMAGQMGNKNITVRSLDVVRVIEGEGLLLVKGPVPGPNKGILEIKTPERLYRTKARKQKESLGA